MEPERDQFEIGKLASEFCTWYGVSTFFRCPYRGDPSDTDIAIVGVPSTAGTQLNGVSIWGHGRFGTRRVGTGGHIGSCVLTHSGCVGSVTLVTRPSRTW